MTVHCPITQNDYPLCINKHCLYYIDSKVDYNCGQKMNATQLAHMKNVNDYPKRVSVGKINIARCIVLYEIIGDVVSKVSISDTTYVDSLPSETVDILTSVVLRFPYTWTKDWTVDRLCQAILDFPAWSEKKGCSMPSCKVFGVSEEIIENVCQTLLQ